MRNHILYFTFFVSLAIYSQEKYDKSFYNDSQIKEEGLAY